MAKTIGDCIEKIKRGICNVFTFGIYDIAVPREPGKSVGDAVQAVLDESMWHGDQREALNLLKTNQSEDYYKAFIKIIKSSAWSGDKLEMIRSLNEKF